MFAWFVSDEKMRLGYGDDRLVAIGETHQVEGSPKVGQKGLHASVRLLDALEHAPGGQVIWQVCLSGKIDVAGNQVAASRRTYTQYGFDAGSILQRFARNCAIDVLHLWNAPETLREYLLSESQALGADVYKHTMRQADTGVEMSAIAAARAAVTGTAHGAANGAAVCAARSAAVALAASALRDLGTAAQFDSILVGIKEDQNKRLEKMMLCFRGDNHGVTQDGKCPDDRGLAGSFPDSVAAI